MKVTERGQVSIDPTSKCQAQLNLLMLKPFGALVHLISTLNIYSRQGRDITHHHTDLGRVLHTETYVTFYISAFQNQIQPHTLL